MIGRINSAAQIGRLNRVRRKAAEEFSPLDAPGILLWWDFADVSTLYVDDGSTGVTTDGDLIYRVDDKSGNGNHGRASWDSDREPVYKTGIQNSLSIARFYDDNLEFNSGLTTIRSAYFVFSITNVGSLGGQAFLLGHSSQYDWHRGSDANYIDADTGLYTYFGADASSYAKNGSVYRNGVSVSPTANSPFMDMHLSVVITTGNMRASCFQKDRWGTRFLRGDLAELIIYDTAHDSNTRQSLENHLNNKWDIY
jgi:hypothetical protein